MRTRLIVPAAGPRSLRVVPARGPTMGFSLWCPSGVGLWMCALQLFACVDLVIDASSFPHRLSFDRVLSGCIGAVFCGR